MDGCRLNWGADGVAVLRQPFCHCSAAPLAARSRWWTDDWPQAFTTVDVRRAAQGQLAAQAQVLEAERARLTAQLHAAEAAAATLRRGKGDLEAKVSTQAGRGGGGGRLESWPL